MLILTALIGIASLSLMSRVVIWACDAEDDAAVVRSLLGK